MNFALASLHEKKTQRKIVAIKIMLSRSVFTIHTMFGLFDQSSPVYCGICGGSDEWKDGMSQFQKQLSAKDVNWR